MSVNPFSEQQLATDPWTSAWVSANAGSGKTHVLVDRIASERATQVMLHVHTRGKGVCGVYTYEIAETKVAQVNEFSRQNEHPLKCTMEKA